MTKKFIKVIRTKPEFKDQRGSITRILDKTNNIRAVLRIVHKAGTPPRANHYHKKDTHWVYIESGKMKYYEKGLNSKSKIHSVTLKSGDLFFTKCNIIHAMVALEDTVFWAFTSEKRKQTTYEDDIVRIKIV